MEPISFTFTIIDHSIQLVVAIRNAVAADKENLGLLSSLKSRITRIRSNFQLFSETPNGTNSAVYNSVQERIHNDFLFLSSKLETVGNNIGKKSRVRRLRTAGNTAEDISAILSRLDSLEKHLDIFGLLKDMRWSFHEMLRMPPTPGQVLLDPPMREFFSDQRDAMNEIIRKLESLTGGSPSTSQPLSSNQDFSKAPIVHVLPEGGLDSFEERSIREMISAPQLLVELTRRLQQSSLPYKFKVAVLGMIKRYENRWSLQVQDIHFDKGSTGDRISFGRGGFSVVYKAELQLRGFDGTPEGAPVKVAVKQLKIGRSELARYKPDVLREIHLLTESKHPCIIHSYGAFWPEKSESEDVLSTAEYFPPMIIMERMTCDLSIALKSKLFSALSIRKKVLVDIAEALAFLHKRNIVHRDVKPENVLIRVVDELMIGSAKLTDFGVSRQVHTTKVLATQTLTSGLTGTIMYMPPEVLMEPLHFVTRRSWDVWSLGILISTVCGKVDEFGLMVTPLTAKSLAETGELAQAAERCAKSIDDNTLRKAALQCLQKDWRDRATMTEVIALMTGKKTNMQKGREEYSEYLRDRDIGAGRRAAGHFYQAWREGEENGAQWLAQCQQNELFGDWDDSIKTYEEGHRRGNQICSYKFGLYKLARAQSKPKCRAALEILKGTKGVASIAAFVGALWRSILEEFGPLLCFLSDAMQGWDIPNGSGPPDSWSLEDGCPDGIMEQVEETLKLKSLDDIIRGDLLCWRAVLANREIKHLAEGEEMKHKKRRAALSDLMASVKLGNCEALAMLGVAFEEYDVDAGDSALHNVGLGVVHELKADKAAFYCIQRSAEQGSLLGMCCLGKYYLNGDGVKANVACGTKWLKKAADRGSRFAIRMLAEMAQHEKEKPD